MGSRIEPLRASEYEEYLRFQHASFRFSGGISSFIFPAEMSANTVATLVAKGQQKMRQSTTSHHVKLVDVETGQLLAIAHWKLFAKERTPGEQQALEKTKHPLPDVNVQAWNDYYDNLRENRRQLGTRPILLLLVFATHPSHRRKGHGTKLLRYILNQADTHALDMYVEASEEGKRLYGQFGFQPVFEKEFDLQRYAGTGMDRNTIMIRPAQRLVGCTSDYCGRKSEDEAGI